MIKTESLTDITLWSLIELATTYDIILGGEFLRKIGMNLNYTDSSIEWLGNTAPMDSLNTPQLIAEEVKSYLYQMNLEGEGSSELDAYASPILDAKYEKVDIEEIIKEHCSHLNKTQQGQLKDILLKYDKLFDGVLKEYPGQPMHIDLQPNDM